MTKEPVGHHSSNVSDNEEPMGQTNSLKAAASLMKEVRLPSMCWKPGFFGLKKNRCETLKRN